MERKFYYLIGILLLLGASLSSFAQQERITNWDFGVSINGVNPFTTSSAWNEFDFDLTSHNKDDIDASNEKSLNCKRSKFFHGKDVYGIGQYCGRAQSVIPCPEPGTEYTLSARAKMKNDLAGEAPGEVALFFYNDNEEVILNPVLYFSNTSYETQSVSFTVPDEAVWCRVWARKTETKDFYTDWVSLKTDAADDSPSEVTGFTAAEIGTTSVLLEWNPVAGARGYEIGRKNATDLTWSTVMKTLEGGTSSSFLDSRDIKKMYLEAGLAYNYRIIALGDYGNSDTVEIDVTMATTTPSPGNTTYYIDATGGDDAATGTSKDAAWKGFMNIDRMELAPGDSVLLKRGEYWTESLLLHGSGEAGNEITVASYGTSPEQPIINVEAIANAAVRLLDVSYYRVKDLELSNFHPQFRELGKFAVEAGTFRSYSVTGLHFDNLYINKVRGTATRGGNGGYISEGEVCAGIRLATDIRRVNRDNRKISEVSITNCMILDAEQHSMHLVGEIDGIVITNNIVNRGGVTNMLTTRVSNGTIANNFFIEAGYTMTNDDNAGVGFYGGDNILFEHNVVYKTRNINSGQSINMDGCDNWIVQHNFFKESGSGCFVINHGADGNIFRYNISEGFNDQWFRNLGGVNTKIYNNTAYVYATNTPAKGFFVSNSRTVSSDPKPTENTEVYNNIFMREDSDTVITSELVYEDPNTVNSDFSNNVYYGNFFEIPAMDRTPFSMDPIFVDPGTGYVDTSNYTINVDGYKLQDSSPYCRVGMIIPDNGETDFWGNTLPSHSLSVGAHQSQVYVGIIEHPVETNSAELMQNYPNPFQKTTFIQYFVPDTENGTDQEVILSIYDTRGRLLNTLVNESQKPGMYTVQWNRDDNLGYAITGSICFYNIRIGDFFACRKMILSD
ncbi:MAG: hypothetical protein ABFS38_07915 [Bacteroidota bacterium]